MHIISFDLHVCGIHYVAVQWQDLNDIILIARGSLGAAGLPLEVVWGIQHFRPIGQSFWTFSCLESAVAGLQFDCMYSFWSHVQMSLGFAVCCVCPCPLSGTNNHVASPSLTSWKLSRLNRSLNESCFLCWMSVALQSCLNFHVNHVWSFLHLFIFLLFSCCCCCC